jgi:hypothetical protein
MESLDFSIYDGVNQKKISSWRQATLVPENEKDYLTYGGCYL